MKLFISMLCAVCFLTACNSGSNREEQALKSKQETIDSMKVVLAKQAVIDSMNAVASEREEKDKQIEASNNVVASNPTPVVVEKRKKKWSHTAKGAVVGAGTGAITGAIVNKKRAEGAIVGTLIGAGVGAGTGAIVDASKKKKNKGN